jgi:hypothetical protein
MGLGSFGQSLKFGFGAQNTLQMLEMHALSCRFSSKSGRFSATKAFEIIRFFCTAPDSPAK